MSTKFNPRYLFPAPGWKCLQCSVFEDGTVDFMKIPIIGWGSVEGYDCGEDVCKLSEENCQVTHGAEMQLLVALQDGHMEAPMIYPSSDLNEGMLRNVAFGFKYGDMAFDDEDKTMLEQKARKNMMSRRKVA